jgi:quinol monooxygenase YgiN
MVEQRTTRIDEMMALEAEWRQASEGSRTIRQSIILKDRSDPHRFLVLAFFDDEEAARAQSEQPESGEFADKMSALLTGLPRYSQFDVIKQVEY